MLWPFVLLGGLAALASLVGSGESDYDTGENSNRIRFRLFPGEQHKTRSLLLAGVAYKITVSGSYRLCRLEPVLRVFHRERWYCADALSWSIKSYSLKEQPATGRFTVPYSGIVLNDKDGCTPFLEYPEYHEYSFFYQGQGRPLSVESRLPITAVDTMGKLEVIVEPLPEREWSLVPELVEARKAEEARQREAERIREEEERVREESAAAEKARAEEEKRRKKEEELRSCFMEFTLEPATEAFSPYPIPQGKDVKITLDGVYSYYFERAGSWKDAQADALYDAKDTPNFITRYHHLRIDGSPAIAGPLKEQRHRHRYCFAYRGTGEPLSILLMPPPSWIGHFEYCKKKKLDVTVSALLPEDEAILAARKEAAEAQEREAAAEQERIQQEEEHRRAEAERQRQEKAEAAIRERVEQLVRRVQHFGYVENPVYIAGFARENKDWLLKGRAAIIAAYDNFHSDQVFIQRLKEMDPRAYERAAEVWQMKALAQAEQTAFEQPPPPPPWRSYTADEEAVLIERVERLVRNTQHDGFVENPSFIAGFARKNTRYLLGREEAIVAAYDEFHSDKRFVQRLRDTNLHAYERAKPVWEMKALAEARRISVERKTAEAIRASLLWKVRVALDDKISLKKQIAEKIVEAKTILDPFDLDPDERQQLETDLIQQILELEDTSNATGKETL